MSSVFTSVWDVKVIRENLDIPEDQLNVLRNLPEWSSRQNDSFRVEKDSQTTQHISNTSLDINNKLIKNKVIFDNSSETCQSILEAYKLSSKFLKSYSLFELDKISSTLPCSYNLRKTLSIPNIYLCSENLYSKSITSEFINRGSSLDRHLSLNNNNKGLLDIPELEKSAGYTHSGSNMEVKAQLPVMGTCANGLDKLIIENHVVLCNHTSNSQNEFGASVVQLALPKSPNDNFSEENSKAAKNVDLCEKNTCIVREMPGESSTPKISETVVKLMNSDRPDSSEKNELVVTENTIHIDGQITNKNKRIETCVNFQELAKVSETYNLRSKSNYIEMPSENSSLKVSETVDKLINSDGQDLCEKNEPVLNVSEKTIHIDSQGTNENRKFETNVNFLELAKSAGFVSPNEHEVKITCNSNISKLDVENDQQTIHKDVNDNKPVFAETRAIKRKSECKNRSSKKQRKHGHHEEKSLKKASDISYSVEHINTMLDIMKSFF